MRFLGFDLGGPTPDENTIRLFRNKLTETGTLKRVMKAFDLQLRKKGDIPICGQIVITYTIFRTFAERGGSDQTD